MLLKTLFNKIVVQSAVINFSRRTLMMRTCVKRLPHLNGSVRSLKIFQPSCATKFVQEQGPFAPPEQLTFEKVEQRVMKAIKAWDRFPEEKKEALTLDSDFAKDMGFDSLDHVEIIMSLEDEFGFEIPDTDAEKLKTPRDIFKYVCEHEDVFE